MGLFCALRLAGNDDTVGAGLEADASAWGPKHEAGKGSGAGLVVGANQALVAAMLGVTLSGRLACSGAAIGRSARDAVGLKTLARVFPSLCWGLSQTLRIRPESGPGRFLCWCRCGWSYRPR